MLPFNKPYLSGNELNYIYDAVARGHISGDGFYTKQCQKFIQERYGLTKCLLTTSCTDALELSALLLDVQPGDEIIMPSYTFVSTANAFILRGAKIRFVDSRADHPGMDEDLIENLVNEKTKAIVVVHYAGVSVDMDKVQRISSLYNIPVIEDAAQAIESLYKGRPLGSFGNISAFSFHETKNIQCGEGGVIIINDNKFSERAEIIREKGTNRSSFFRGEIDKYGWVDKGSSFLPSDLLAAFLLSQLESINEIQTRRVSIWNRYYELLKPLESPKTFTLPVIPEFASNNAHMFYLICSTPEFRTRLIKHLRSKSIHSVFHYQSLNESQFYQPYKDERTLPYAKLYADTLVRLPLFFELSLKQVESIYQEIKEFVESNLS